MGAISGAIINAKNLSTLPVFGGDRPLCEGPRILPIVKLDFTVTERYFIDYSNQMKQGRISMIQTVFVDASLTDGPVLVEFNTGQALMLQGNSQGFYPVLAQEPFTVVMECLNGGQGTFIFCNFQIPPCQWMSKVV